MRIVPISLETCERLRKKEKPYSKMEYNEKDPEFWLSKQSLQTMAGVK